MQGIVIIVCIYTIFACIGITYGQEYSSYGRQCYSCQSTAGEDNKFCSGTISHFVDYLSGIQKKMCYGNCYTKIDHYGGILRGCFSTSERPAMNTGRLGCHEQGDAIYCICEGQLCNNEDPEISRRTKSLATDPKHIHQSGRAIHLSNQPRRSDHLSGSTRPAQSPNKGNQNKPKQVNSKPYQRRYQSSEKARNYNRFNHDLDNKRLTKKVGTSSHVEEVVHGPVAPYQNQRNIANVHQRRTNYADGDEDLIEHRVEVNSRQRKQNNQRLGQYNGPSSWNNHQKQESDGDFVKHVHQQRQINARHRTGTSDQRYGELTPQNKQDSTWQERNGNPKIKHEQTQHLHSYDIGDRTIEHFIVEHYVLHHRIKEKLKNDKGIDVKNLDPREVSVIYQLLYPGKDTGIDGRLDQHRNP